MLRQEEQERIRKCTAALCLVAKSAVLVEEKSRGKDRSRGDGSGQVLGRNTHEGCVGRGAAADHERAAGTARMGTPGAVVENSDLRGKGRPGDQVVDSTRWGKREGGAHGTIPQASAQRPDAANSTSEAASELEEPVTAAPTRLARPVSARMIASAAISDAPQHGEHGEVRHRDAEQDEGDAEVAGAAGHAATSGAGAGVFDGRTTSAGHDASRSGGQLSESHCRAFSYRVTCMSAPASSAPSFFESPKSLHDSVVVSRPEISRNAVVTAMKRAMALMTEQFGQLTGLVNGHITG